MPTYTFTKHVVDPVIQEYNPCTSSWSTPYTTNRVLSRRVITTNDIIRRAKPAAYGPESWTALNKQSDLLATAGLERHKNGSNSVPCQYNPIKMKKEHAFSSIFFDQNLLLLPDMDFPDWFGQARSVIKQQPINLGTIVAEFPETINMFVDFVHGLRDSVRAIRRRKGFHNFHVSDMGSAHLLAQWGVKPLVEDAFNGVQALNDTLGHPPYSAHYFRVRNEKHVSGSTQGAYSLWGTAWKERRVRLVVYYKTGVSSFVTAGNPLEALWEIVPMSTIIDYMVPIGDYLGSLDALRGVMGLTALVTEREYEKLDNIRVTSEINTFEQLRKPTIHYESHRRYLTDSIGLPPLPTYSPSNSLTHLKNSLALLLSMKKRKH